MSSASHHHLPCTSVKEHLLAVLHLQAFNILRYELKQKYDSHMDTFDPADFGPQYSQRLATVLIYLSEVEEGGETVFKREGRNGEQLGIMRAAAVPDVASKLKAAATEAWTHEQYLGHMYQILC